MFIIFAVNKSSLNMSPRIKRIRKVVNPPTIKGFKPYGLQRRDENAESVNLLIEEYEALRLCDYESYNQFDASIMMGVSRPTFTRIYASALQKIATAFVEGRQMAIEGGKVYFDSDWYQCNDCLCFFNNPEKNILITHCPLCGSKEFQRNEDVDLYENATSVPKEDVCVCMKCHYEHRHRHGNPCKNEVCPQCGGIMHRRNNIKS
jgi:predicted DNA-binding protein (UPF0251 family)